MHLCRFERLRFLVVRTPGQELIVYPDDIIIVINDLDLIANSPIKVLLMLGLGVYRPWTLRRVRDAFLGHVHHGMCNNNEQFHSHAFFSCFNFYLHGD